MKNERTVPPTSNSTIGAECEKIVRLGGVVLWKYYGTVDRQGPDSLHFRRADPTLHYDEFPIRNGVE